MISIRNAGTSDAHGVLAAAMIATVVVTFHVSVVNIADPQFGPAPSMEIRDHAVTYITDDPSHAIETGKENGIKVCSPREVKQALPHFRGLGANIAAPWIVLCPE